MKPKRKADKPRPRKWSDKLAMNYIARAMSGKEWNADTLDTIAEMVRETGRIVRDV